MMRFAATADTDIGISKNTNQDSVLIKHASKFYKNFTEGNYNPFSKTAKSVTEFLDGIKAIPSGGVA